MTTSDMTEAKVKEILSTVTPVQRALIEDEILDMVQAQFSLRVKGADYSVPYVQGYSKAYGNFCHWMNDLRYARVRKGDTYRGDGRKVNPDTGVSPVPWSKV